MSISTTAGAKAEKVIRINSTQAWVAPSDVSFIDVILVAGGGAGGSGSTGNGGRTGGGGGAGGYLETTISVIPNTSYTITIGAGGAAQASDARGIRGDHGIQHPVRRRIHQDRQAGR